MSNVVETTDYRALVQIQSDLSAGLKALDKLEHDINGDGRIGITDRVIRLEQKMWVVWGIGLMLVGAMIAIASSYITTNIKGVTQAQITNQRVRDLEPSNAR